MGELLNFGVFNSFLFGNRWLTVTTEIFWNIPLHPSLVANRVCYLIFHRGFICKRWGHVGASKDF